MTQKVRAVLFARITSVCCLVLVAAVSCAPTAPVDVSGGWSGTMTYTSGPMTSFTSSFRLDLFADDGTVAGSVTLPSGYGNEFEIPVTLGEVHADTIILEAEGMNTFTTPDTPVRIAFDGAATATSMSGVGTHVVSGSAYTFTWSATLVTPPVVDAE